MEPGIESLEEALQQPATVAELGNADVMEMIGEYELKLRALLKAVQQRDTIIASLQERIAFLETDQE